MMSMMNSNNFEIPQQQHQQEPQHTEAHKVIAERYKTKLCRNWVAMGMCPYEVRCMFAHGEQELRTTEMNLRDGLVTDEAIRNFKKMMQLKAQARAIVHDTNNFPAAPVAAPVNVTTAPALPAGFHIRRVAAARPAFAPIQQHPASVAYTHDPYGWMFNPECGCAECAGFHGAALRSCSYSSSPNKLLSVEDLSSNNHVTSEEDEASCDGSVAQEVRRAQKTAAGFENEQIIADHAVAMP